MELISVPASITSCASRGRAACEAVPHLPSPTGPVSSCPSLAPYALPIPLFQSLPLLLYSSKNAPAALSVALKCS
eukprot:scaffold262174_cov26-Tisochrysis_lutea.AAC.3